LAGVSLIDRCTGFPTRDLNPGDVLLIEGERSPVMFVTVEGTFDISSGGERISVISERGVALGEVSALLDSVPSATVVATTSARVHVVEDPLSFMSADPTALVEIARTLAGRLDRLTGYLTDVKKQYAGAGGHLELMDEVLAELAFGDQPKAEPGSQREPDPYY
jgi:CRP-like cAMP-binding protein